MKTDTVETLFKKFYLHSAFIYELPDIQFWAHVRSQISKPMLLRN